jgi:diguanylate cyclase (GGDEF)-like protein
MIDNPEAGHAPLDRITYLMVRPAVQAALREMGEVAGETRREALQIARRAAYLAAVTLREQEIAERLEAKRLRELSRTDPVTGIDNRNGYEVNVRESFLQAREQGIPLTIVTLDLNDIDVINAQKGRKEGDRWIQTTASILNGSCPRRPSRWGGDEYGVVLLDVDEAAAHQWWNDIRSQFDEAGIHISAGAATYHPSVNGTDLETVIYQTHEFADTALYAAKALAKQHGTNILLNVADLPHIPPEAT